MKKQKIRDLAKALRIGMELKIFSKKEIKDFNGFPKIELNEVSVKVIGIDCTSDSLVGWKFIVTDDPDLPHGITKFSFMEYKQAPDKVIIEGESSWAFPNSVNYVKGLNKMVDAYNTKLLVEQNRIIKLIPKKYSGLNRDNNKRQKDQRRERAFKFITKIADQGNVAYVYAKHRFGYCWKKKNIDYIKISNMGLPELHFENDPHTYSYKSLYHSVRLEIPKDLPQSPEYEEY